MSGPLRIRNTSYDWSAPSALGEAKLAEVRDLAKQILNTYEQLHAPGDGGHSSVQSRVDRKGGPVRRLHAEVERLLRRLLEAEEESVALDLRTLAGQRDRGR